MNEYDRALTFVLNSEMEIMLTINAVIILSHLKILLF